jgi:PilZ domain
MGMFSLIRRRSGKLDDGSTEAAFESTTVSLSTAVPRPAERRSDERVSAMLRVGKLTMASGEQQLIKIKNLSAGGLMAIVNPAPQINEQVNVELSSQKIPASVVWIRDDTVGLKFDHNVDLGELLAGRKPRHGFRARPPRLEIACKASVRVGKLYYNVDVHDISLGGMKVEPIEEYCVGKKVVVVVESLRPIKGEVRWYSDRLAGIVFDKPLDFDELAEWVGKRLELASLKASYKGG